MREALPHFRGLCNSPLQGLPVVRVTRQRTGESAAQLLRFSRD